MKISRKLGCLLWVIGAIGAIFLALRLFLPWYQWHQELTVTVDTPSGVVSGSSITSVAWSKKDSFSAANSSNWSRSHKGEATFVDLGEGRFLFALIGGAFGWAPSVFKDELVEAVKDPARWAPKIVGFEGQARAFPPSNYPLLVTFGNINDPASVKRVDPFDMDGALGLCPDGSGLRDDNAPWRVEKMTWREWARYQASGVSTLGEYRTKRFNRPQEEAMEAAIVPRDTSGDCHRLKSITLEITDEKVTRGRVEEVLGWIYSSGYIIPPDQKPRLSKDLTVEQKITPSDFIDGKRWYEKYKQRNSK